MKKLFNKYFVAFGLKPSASIIKQSIKDNWKMWLAITVVLAIFTTIMTITAPNRADRVDNHPLLVSSR